MQNLILLFSKYSSVFLFLLFEAICLYFIVQFNQRQRSIFINSSSYLSASVLNRYDNIASYFHLQEINDSLQNENARLLKNTFQKTAPDSMSSRIMGSDTLMRFEVIPAEIINKTVANRNNSLTINKGKRQGVENGMGVISSNGIVGIVRNSSRNFSHIISLLNTQMQVSAKLKRGNILGELKWRGIDPSKVTMEAVPKHADIVIGDTVVTSGYSTIFPEDFMIGLVESFNLEPNGFYNVSVKLNNDFYSLDRVYVVKNLYKSELDSLQLIQ